MANEPLQLNLRSLCSAVSLALHSGWPHHTSFSGQRGLTSKA